MKKAGAIVSLIAGVFGIFASIFTIMSGGFVGALEEVGSTSANAGDAIIGMGFWGILLSFLIIIFGALSLSSNSNKNGIILIILSILGVWFGGSFVGVCMFLSLVGGILVAIGSGKK